MRPNAPIFRWVLPRDRPFCRIMLPSRATAPRFRNPPRVDRGGAIPLRDNGDLESFARACPVFRGVTVVVTHCVISTLWGTRSRGRHAPVAISECFRQGPRDWGRFRLGLWLFRTRGGFVLPYRWFVLGVGIGRSTWRRFRFILSLVRVGCWFLTFRLALVSLYPAVGSR